MTISCVIYKDSTSLAIKMYFVYSKYIHRTKSFELSSPGPGFLGMPSTFYVVHFRKSLVSPEFSVKLHPADLFFCLPPSCCQGNICYGIMSGYPFTFLLLANAVLYLAFKIMDFIPRVKIASVGDSCLVVNGFSGAIFPLFLGPLVYLHTEQTKSSKLLQSHFHPTRLNLPCKHLEVLA